MNIKQLTQKMHQFVNHQGWYEEDSPRPQTPKNLACSLAIECGEILELVQWRAEIQDREALAAELADVMLYLLQLASTTDIDLEEAVLNKLTENYQRTWDPSPPDKEKEENDE